MNPATALTELEQRLAGPDGAALCATLAQRLIALEHHACRQLDSGLVPVAFQQCQAVAQAAAAAREVLAGIAPAAAPAPPRRPLPLPPDPLGDATWP